MSLVASGIEVIIEHSIYNEFKSIEEVLHHYNVGHLHVELAYGQLKAGTLYLKVATAEVLIQSIAKHFYIELSFSQLFLKFVSHAYLRQLYKIS